MPSFLQVIGDTVGVDKSTVARALAAKQEIFIKWPTTNAELVENKNAFYRRGGFPSVIDNFGGSHFVVKTNEEYYGMLSAG